MLDKILDEKRLPSFLPRSEMLDMIQREEYGYIPPSPESISFAEEDFIPNFCAGKAVCKKVYIKTDIHTKNGDVILHLRFYYVFYFLYTFIYKPSILL